ncbi:clasp N terminal-domain-containing protein [Xylariaceae sp. FL0255]|nr:clasp N terminal-domain-containing protein [Xylariaceae sp. FL0255]
MADKISDDQVSGLLAILKKDTTIDAKVQYVTHIKSGIKQHNVPDSCVAPLFDGLRQASTAQHTSLVNAGFTALNHLLTRLSRQDPKFLIKEAKQTLPLIVDKMGDQKDKFRTLAIQAMATLYIHVPNDAERFIRNTAMAGKNPRAKESGLHWLLQMHKENGLQFRTYVPTLMELLEDADGMVRDVAKSTVIELFKEAPNAAKSDLKKQLKNFKVRPAIEAAIIKELNPISTKVDTEIRPASALQTRSNLTASLSSHASERPNTPAPTEIKPDAVEPTYVNTQRELDELLKGMHMWFDGKESEQNWVKREESITKLRKLIAGNASTDFPDQLVAGCRGLLDGILKGVNSLRTSLSKESCSLVQDLAITFGPAIDPMVELLMQNFVKLCANTKKIASQLGNTTVDIIIGKVTYTSRIMQHIWGACQDKNVQPRTYAPGWLKTILTKHATHKNVLEHGGGLDLIEKCIKKGLNDPNPGVREKMRTTYWFFATLWSGRADAIMDTLDATAQKLLQKDPNNPNSPKKPQTAARPGLGLSKSTMGGAKPSLRETMMAQKKALSTRALPARPGSAMATISPVRTVSGTSNAPTASAAGAPTTRTRPDSAMTKSHGGMSVAPMRPVRRRPEIAARPATAGPYSVRTHDGPSMEESSPQAPAKLKTITPKTISGSPKRTAPRPRFGHAATASDSNVAAPIVAAPSPGKTQITQPQSALIKDKMVSPGIPSPEKTQTAEPQPTPIEESMVSPGTPKPENTPTTQPHSAPAKEKLATPRTSLLEKMRFEQLRITSISEQTASQATTAPGNTQIEQPQPASIKEPTVLPNTPLASKTLEVFEDLSEGTQNLPVTKKSPTERPVLEDIPVNEDAAKLAVQQARIKGTIEFLKNTRHIDDLLNSVIAKLDYEKGKDAEKNKEGGMGKPKSLDALHLRTLQNFIRRESELPQSDKFDTLLAGLFEYLGAPFKVQDDKSKVADVKIQVFTTIQLLFEKYSGRFEPHVSQGLESLLCARKLFAQRRSVVHGIEKFAPELAKIGDHGNNAMSVIRVLQSMDLDTADPHTLNMGLLILKELIDLGFVPNESEVNAIAGLAYRCLEAKDSLIRMDAVHLCVSLHDCIGDAPFWRSAPYTSQMRSIITYYYTTKQRETIT